LNGLPHEVIGVLPRTFEFPGETADIWTPPVLRNGTEAPSRTSHFLNVYARLKPGVTLNAARAEMDRIGLALEQEHLDDSRGHGSLVVSVRAPIRRGGPTGR